VEGDEDEVNCVNFDENELKYLFISKCKSNVKLK
jgi:hypothetical protein